MRRGLSVFTVRSALTHDWVEKGAKLMSQTSIDVQRLTELASARRNRFYYGKLMDVLHFSMEQQYVLAKEWLYNRAVLGPGVVCGLQVEPLSNASGDGIVVRSGMAIDAWGREIVVPYDVPLVPLALTDQCGQTSQQSMQFAAKLMIQLCYSECLTDFAPALVNDPGCCCGGDCEAGTVVESFCLKVQLGTGTPVTEPCLDDVWNGIQAGTLHDVLCTLAEACPTNPSDPCLTLANVTATTNADGTMAVSIDNRTPRLIAPT